MEEYFLDIGGSFLYQVFSSSAGRVRLFATFACVHVPWYNQHCAWSVCSYRDIVAAFVKGACDAALTLLWPRFAFMASPLRFLSRRSLYLCARLCVSYVCIIDHEFSRKQPMHDFASLPIYQNFFKRDEKVRSYEITKSRFIFHVYVGCSFLLQKLTNIWKIRGFLSELSLEAYNGS